MTRFVFYISLLLVFTSCNEEKKEKVINISDRAPKSKREHFDLDTTRMDPLYPILIRFRDVHENLVRIRESDERSFLERFRPDSIENYVWYLKDGDSLTYQRTVFKDSVKTKSAFFNWMDHEDVSYFGANERINKEATAILYTDTMILILTGAVNLKYWEEFFVEEEWMEEGDYWIKQRKFGKAQWFVREEDEFKDLTDL